MILCPVSESQRVTIGSLPDNVLIEIFDFYQVFIDDWEKLVHVCQRWRYLMFYSPIRLNLQLFCTARSPVENLLDVWPPFPLFIRANYHREDLDLSEPAEDLDMDREDSFLDNVVAALERFDRVRHIDILNIPDSLLEKLATAMQGPFPALRFLSLMSDDVPAYPLPDTFLNGSAPCLRHLALEGISYPSLPQLLSSTSDLTSLCLYGVPNSASGYVPPETMATCLSALPKLETFVISFESRTRPSLPPRRNLPQTRFVLPALTVLVFKGVSEYLEDLAARIDAPQLDEFRITFSHQPVLDIPQTLRFFGHLDIFRPSSLTLIFSLYSNAFISFSSRHSTCPYYHFACPYSWQITCQNLDQQVISVAQICSQILPFRSSVKSLNIRFTGILSLLTEEKIPNPTLWSQLFRVFTSVQSLEIPAILEPSVAAALQGLTGESSAEVFPSLPNLSVV